MKYRSLTNIPNVANKHRQDKETTMEHWVRMIEIAHESIKPDETTSYLNSCLRKGFTITDETKKFIGSENPGEIDLCERITNIRTKALRLYKTEFSFPNGYYDHLMIVEYENKSHIRISKGGIVGHIICDKDNVVSRGLTSEFVTSITLEHPYVPEKRTVSKAFGHGIALHNHKDSKIDWFCRIIRDEKDWDVSTLEGTRPDYTKSFLFVPHSRANEKIGNVVSHNISYSEDSETLEIYDIDQYKISITDEIIYAWFPFYVGRHKYNMLYRIQKYPCIKLEKNKIQVNAEEYTFVATEVYTQRQKLNVIFDPFIGGSLSFILLFKLGYYVKYRAKQKNREILSIFHNAIRDRNIVYREEELQRLLPLKDAVNDFKSSEYLFFITNPPYNLVPELYRYIQTQISTSPEKVIVFLANTNPGYSRSFVRSEFMPDSSKKFIMVEKSGSIKTVNLSSLSISYYVNQQYQEDTSEVIENKTEVKEKNKGKRSQKNLFATEKDFLTEFMTSMSVNGLGLDYYTQDFLDTLYINYIHGESGVTNSSEFFETVTTPREKSFSRRAINSNFRLEEFKQLYIRNIILQKIPDLYSKYSSINIFYTKKMEDISQEERSFYEAIGFFKGLDSQDVPNFVMDKIFDYFEENTRTTNLPEIQGIISANIEQILHDILIKIVVEIGKYLLDEIGKLDGGKEQEEFIEKYIIYKSKEIDDDFSIVTLEKFWNGDEHGDGGFAEFLIPDEDASRYSQLLKNFLQ